MVDVQVVQEMIGKPYDTLEHNCWHSVRDVQRRLYGCILPEVDVDAYSRKAVVEAFAAEYPERENWIEVPEPRDGAIVMMAKRTRTAHAGVYVALDEGLILHCDAPHGVAAERPLELQARCWGKLRYCVPKKG